MPPAVNSEAQVKFLQIIIIVKKALTSIPGTTPFVILGLRKEIPGFLYYTVTKIMN